MTGEILHGQDHEGDLELDCDVVVIGSGSGGAVAATVLAEAGQRVIVLEDGAHVEPTEYGRMRPSESMRHIWRDGGTTMAVGLGDSPMINVTMGRCVGGSSVLTGGVCFRTPDFVLDEWAKKLGLEDLAPDRMAPYFEEVEEAVHVEEVPASMRSLSTLRFAQGIERMGLECKPMRRNTRDCDGCGRCNFGCPHQSKMSVDIAFLPRAVKAGATIVSDARVERVLTHGMRAVGVAGRVRNGPGRKPKGELTVHAKRVVCATGAWSSPALLRRTGIGKQSGQLGKNMTLHPAFRVMARFDEPIEGWKGALQSMFCDAYEHDRILFNSLFVPPGVLAGVMPGIGPAFLERAKAVPNLAIFGGMIHDDSGGEIHNLLGRTVATYRMSRIDRSLIPRILRTMGTAFFEGGAREIFLPILGQVAGLDADQFRALDLEAIPPRKIECSSQHPLGTTRMGITPWHSVVDPDGQTWELEELFVADGGIMPTSLGVNPQISIMTMAMRIASKLRERPLPS